MNKIILVGNLGADPIFKTTGSNRAMCTFRMATDDYYNRRDADGNVQRVNSTDWHDVVVWGDDVKNMIFLRKGSEVLVEGKLKTRSYESGGREVRVTEVKAQTVKFLGNIRTHEEANEVRNSIIAIE